MIEVTKQLQPYDARLVLAVHDELVVEAAEEQAEDVAKILEKAMIEGGSRVQKKTPVVAEASVGKTWGDLK